MHLPAALKGAAVGTLRVLRRAARKGRPLVALPIERLPVAGLDALAAQSIHYTLRNLDGVSPWLLPCRHSADAGRTGIVALPLIA